MASHSLEDGFDIVEPKASSMVEALRDIGYSLESAVADVIDNSISASATRIDNATSGPVCFETFPQAVACALAGKVVSAKRKSAVRRELLRKAGIDTAPLTNIDTVDAALCALAAHSLLAGSYKTYGDATEGLILVPA